MRRRDEVPWWFAMLLILCIGGFISGWWQTTSAAPEPSTAQKPTLAPPYTDRLMSYEVYDGDTLTQVEIDLGYGITLKDSVRIAGIDTPEVTGPQRDAGLVVRDYVRVWLGPPPVYLIGLGRDKYGRILGDVQPFGVGQTLSEQLIDKGYAHRYDGTGPRPVWTPAELDVIASGE